MINTPADVLRKFLTDRGVVVPPSAASSTTWPAVTGRLPSSAQDNYLGIIDTGGIMQGRIHRTGENVIGPTVQVTIRSVDYPTGFRMGKAIEVLLSKVGVPESSGGLGRVIVTVGNHQYSLNAVHVSVPTTRVGEEQTNRRQLFTLNLQLSVEALTEQESDFNLPFAL